ncbi:cytochrome bd oxidase small subunit CydS [Cytobacillus firmus]
MAEFVMFYAPFIVIIASIAAAFWLAGKDEIVEE